MTRLKELREERNWNMREAARFLNKKYTTYVNHEKGYREIKSEELSAYAKAYDVSIDYLVGKTDLRFGSISHAKSDPDVLDRIVRNVELEEGKKITALFKEDGLNDQQIELMDILPELTDQDISVLLSTAKALANSHKSQDV